MPLFIFEFIFAFGLLAHGPEAVVDSNVAAVTEEEVLLEDVLDDLDVEEIVFDDLTFSSDEDELDLE